MAGGLSDIRTIVWDLDGTLLDSFGIHVDIMTQILRKYGRLEPTYDQLRRNFHGKLEESLRGLAGADTPADEFAAMLEDFLKIDNEYIEDIDHHLFVDAIGLAKRAKAAGIHQVLVTNRAHGVGRGMASPRAMIEHSVLNGLITEVVCGDEAEVRKPDPRVLGYLKHQPEPNRTLMIGDQAVDALFAHNFGAQAVLANRFDDDVRHMELFYEAGGREANLRIEKSLSGIMFRE